MPNWNRLSLEQNSKVTDAGLAQLRDRANLVALDLSLTQITDDGLGQLQGLTCQSPDRRRPTCLLRRALDPVLRALKRPTAIACLRLFASHRRG